MSLPPFATTLLDALRHAVQAVTGPFLSPGSLFSFLSLGVALAISVAFLVIRRKRKRPLRLRALWRALFPKRIWRHASTRADIGYWLLNTFVTVSLIGADGRTWLARDPFGIKPLYLLEHDAGLAFASEPRAFAAAGLLAPELEPEAGEELLGFSYALGPRSIFKGVRRLAPGEVLEVRDGRIVGGWRRPALGASPQGEAAAGRFGRVMITG